MKSETSNHYSKFLLIWAGQFTSIIGTGLTIFALGIFVYQTTHTASSYVFILMCVFLPPFLLKPFGGVLADRYDRRLMMVLSDLGATLGLLFIFFSMLSGNVQLWQIYLGISVSSVFSAFQEPAYKSLVSDLLPEELYSKASGLMQLATSAQYLISPFLAGILLTLMNLKYIFLIDISTLIISSSIVLIIRKQLGTVPKKQSNQNFLHDFNEGINVFRQNKGVVNLVFTIAMVLFFVGLLQSLMVPMLLNITTAKIIGISQSICASGMIAGSLFIGLLGSGKKYVKALSISLFFTGIFFSGLGLSTKIILITISGFLFFSTLPFVNTSIEVLIRTNIQNSKQGRVWAIISTLTYLGSVVAFAIAGLMADKIFNPLLIENGLLVNSIGKITGVGEGRGIALIFILSGMMISGISFFINNNKSILLLENVSQKNKNE